MVAINHYFVNQ